MSRDALETRVAQAVRAALGQALTLEQAKSLMERIESAAEALGVGAIVALCDAGGQLMALHRMDGGMFGSVDIAMNKAFTAAALERSTRELGEQAQPGGPLYGIQWTNGGRMVIFGGGEPLFSRGILVGALGISGGTLEQDTALAAAGRRLWEEEQAHGG